MLTFPAIGTWSPEQIHVSWTASTRPSIPEVEQLIDGAWRETLQRPGIHLFDGPMCRLESLDAHEGAMHLRFSRTSYKPFLGTNLTNAHLADKYGSEALANSVGLSALVISSDDFVMLGRRNDRVAYYPGRVHPFSGALEPRDDLDVFDDIRRELREELSLGEDGIEQLICAGIAMDMSIRQPEMIFVVRALRTRQQIESQLDAGEHRGTWSARAAREAIENALHSDERFTPVGVASMLLCGRIEFGEDWYACVVPRYVEKH
jgi:hypothetical protein